MGGSVFVSGATGYIAVHTAKELIERGYHVVGSVRTEQKGENLKRKLGAQNFDYEIVGDISREGSFDEALKKHPEVSVFLHIASPVTVTIEDPEKDLYVPAIDGTKNALLAAKRHGKNIKQVVVTSSLAAMWNILEKYDSSRPLSENVWNTLTREQAARDPMLCYTVSKALAEKAVWDFVEQEKPSFGVNTVNPSFVFGPQAFDEDAVGDVNFSADLLASLFKLKPDDPVSGEAKPFIDVRDIAKAHIHAFEKGFNGQRLLVSEESWSPQKVLDILHENYPQAQGKLARGDPGKYETEDNVENSKTKSLLGFKFIDLKTSVVDSYNQYLKMNPQ